MLYVLQLVSLTQGRDRIWCKHHFCPQNGEEIKCFSGICYMSESNDHISVCGTIQLFVSSGDLRILIGFGAVDDSPLRILIGPSYIDWFTKVYFLSNEWFSLSTLVQPQFSRHMHQLISRLQPLESRKMRYRWHCNLVCFKWPASKEIDSRVAVSESGMVDTSPHN